MSGQRQAYIAALKWHMDIGADALWDSAPVDATAMPELRAMLPPKAAPDAGQSNKKNAPAMILGAAEAHKQALQSAIHADSLEALRTVIEEFEGIPLKKTAMNMVFSSGDPSAKIMIIGDAPGADDDQNGQAFSGIEGALLDKIIGTINLSREGSAAQEPVYMTHMVNWRPPGGRSLNEGEIMACLPFVEKHIALIKPDFLIFCGGPVAKTLLGRAESISRLRGKILSYSPLSQGLFEAAPAPIACIATYDTSYIMKTPAQKRLVWQDMLTIERHIQSEESAPHNINVTEP
jgi:DNA polymerase